MRNPIEYAESSIFPLDEMPIRTLEGLPGLGREQSYTAHMRTPAGMVAHYSTPSLGTLPVLGLHEFDGMLADQYDVEGLGSISRDIPYEAIGRDAIGRMKNFLINFHATFKGRKLDQGETNMREALRILLNVWENEEARDKALQRLAVLEAGTPAINGLGASSISRFFDRIRKGINDIKEKVAKKHPKLFPTIKKVTHDIAKFTPATAAARGGMLLAFKMNMFQLGAKVGFGLQSAHVAKRYGLSTTAAARARKIAVDVQTMFYKIGGEKENIRKAILEGWNRAKKRGKLLNLSGLGEPATLAIGGTVAAAMPFLVKIFEWLKSIDWKALKEGTDIAKDIAKSAGELVDTGRNFFDQHGGGKPGTKKAPNPLGPPALDPNAFSPAPNPSPTPGAPTVPTQNQTPSEGNKALPWIGAGAAIAAIAVLS